MSRTAVLVVELPGLGHRLVHDPAAAVADVAARDARWRVGVPSLRRQGARWVAAGPVDELVPAALWLVSDRVASAVVDAGPVVTWDEEPWGLGLWRAGRIVSTYGRAGEVLVTDAVSAALDPLPIGLGRFAAPAEISRLAGVGLWRIADYRDGASADVVSRPMPLASAP